MMLVSVQAGALQNSQSPAVAVRGGDGGSMEPTKLHRCSVLLTFQRINVLVPTLLLLLEVERCLRFFD